MNRVFLAAISLSLWLLNWPAFAGSISCQARCPGAAPNSFYVDVSENAKCMCLSNGECFKIDIGKDGPNMTVGGTGKTHEAKGQKYSTTPGPGNTGYDKDAIATGIAGNDAVGKWIHKTQSCSPGGRRATKGCIAVPCDMWPLVKKEMGKQIVICGSTNSAAAGTGGFGAGEGRYDGESEDNGEADAKK